MFGKIYTAILVIVFAVSIHSMSKNINQIKENMGDVSVLKELNKTSLHVLYEVLDVECLKELRSGKENGSACELSDEIEKILNWTYED